MEALSEPVAMNRVPMYSMILVGAAFFKTDVLAAKYFVLQFCIPN